jgi:hypothetical protein
MASLKIDQTRALVTGKIWQAIAQSGVDTSSLPKEEMDKLVSSISDGILVTVNELLGEASQDEREAQPFLPGTDPAEEQVLWEGRPFLSLVEHYTVTTQRVRITRGLLSKDRQDIELIRVQDIDHSQKLTERMMNIGDIVLRSADASTPEVELRNVGDPEKVHEIIRRAMLEARKRNLVRFREEV